MILKSDAAAHSPGEIPPDMAGKPIVSLLEFMALDLPRRPGSGFGPPTIEEKPAEKVDVGSVEQTARENEARIQERALQTRTMIDAARAEAKLEARRELERELEAKLLAERKRVAQVCADFMRDRQRYFADAEEQVVKLALAIAARVLHREAMMDPLLLSGAVRVAVAKVEESSAVSLRVVPADVALWRREFPPETEPLVEVIADERLGPGELILETVVGRVELGVAVQLEEIEQGFFDLLQRRPN